jgi:hypothetical protein
MSELRDWTHDATGRSNSSATFIELCRKVERLIRDDAHQLIGGRAGNTAGLVMAQLAHRHGLVPIAVVAEWLREEADRLAVLADDALDYHRAHMHGDQARVLERLANSLTQPADSAES